MNLFAVSGFVWGISTLSLGIFVLGVGKTKLHRMWAIYNFVVTIWAFGYAMAAISKDVEAARLWWLIANIGGFLNGVVLFHIVCIIGKLERKWILITGYLLAAIFQILAFMGKTEVNLLYLFNSFYFPSPSYYAIKFIGINFPIIAEIFLFYVAYALYELLQIYRKSAGADKKHAGWFLFGMFTAYFGAAVLSLFPIFGINWYPYGNFSAPIYFAVMTYAIFRHQMLNLEVIIKKSLVFAGLFASLFGILIFPTLLINEFIFRSASVGGKLIGFAISGIIIILTMHRIESFLINVTDKYLFQKKYDYKQLLKLFTTEVLTVLELDKLLDFTVDKLTDTIRLSSSAILLFNDEEQQFEVMAQRNIKDPNVKLIKPDGIVTFLDETHGYILVKEFRNKKIFIPESIQEIIVKLNAELIIPMVVHEEVIGILSLGKKKSDEDYTQDDLDILLPLSRTLGIAISNAQLFVTLTKTQAEAAQKDKMAVIGTLSAGINHEICNPLGIARGQCEAFLLNLKDGYYKTKSDSELLERAKEIMAKVIVQTDRATAITKKLSQFAKPSKGDCELVDIAKEVDDVLGLVGYEMKLDKVDVIKDVANGMSKIFVDKKLLQEVLFNLIRNAGQAMDGRGKVTVSVREERGRILIDIKDTGNGIPEDKIKQLFNPFFTTKDPGKGTGLGLFIVRQIVEKNGGRIYLKSTKIGEGTTFALEFPVADTADSGKRKDA